MLPNETETVYLVYHTSKHIPNSVYKYDVGPVLIHTETQTIYRKDGIEFAELIINAMNIAVYMNKDDIYAGNKVISQLIRNHPYGPGIMLIYETTVEVKQLLKYIIEYDKYLKQ